MSRSNYTADLKAQGLAAPSGFDKLWDESAGFGGPIRNDRVWFFYAQRYRGNDTVGTMRFSQRIRSPLHTIRTSRGRCTRVAGTWTTSCA